MSNLKKTHETIRQNGEIVKKSQKHETNLQKNSTLYFQIGLIVCLLAAYGLLEMKFETTITKIGEVLPPNDPTEITIRDFKVYEKPVTKPEPKIQQKRLLIDEIEKVDNDFKLKEIFKVIATEQNTSSDPPIDPSKITVVEEDDPVNVPYDFIQNVPIYPGCEKAKGNIERKKCMSEKITKLIQRKFHGDDIAIDYGLYGRQKIDVQFTIDKTGKVNNIKTRAPHPKLQDETVRVINMIPEMIPGKQNDKNVGVIYTLPIVFQVQ